MGPPMPIRGLSDSGPFSLRTGSRRGGKKILASAKQKNSVSEAIGEG